MVFVNLRESDLKPFFQYPVNNFLDFFLNLNLQTKCYTTKIKVADEFTTFSYDENGLLTCTKGLSGYEIKRELDECFRVKSLSDRKGPLVSFAFDAEGRIKEEIFLNGKMTYDYNLEGNLSKITDKLGASTEFFYDKKGSLIQTVDAEGNVFSFR
jgi:YD repeat-containing protein